MPNETEQNKTSYPCFCQTTDSWWAINTNPPYITLVYTHQSCYSITSFQISILIIRLKPLSGTLTNSDKHISWPAQPIGSPGVVWGQVAGSGGQEHWQRATKTGWARSPGCGRTPHCGRDQHTSQHCAGPHRRLHSRVEWTPHSVKSNYEEIFACKIMKAMIF